MELLTDFLFRINFLNIWADSQIFCAFIWVHDYSFYKLCTWVHLVTLGFTWAQSWFTWCHLGSLQVNSRINQVYYGSLGFTWIHLVLLGSLGFIRVQSGPHWFTWTHFDSLGFSWAQLGSLLFNWVQLDSLGFNWVHFGLHGLTLVLLGFTWVHLGSLTFTWVTLGWSRLIWVDLDWSGFCGLIWFEPMEKVQNEQPIWGEEVKGNGSIPMFPMCWDPIRSNKPNI